MQDQFPFPSCFAAAASDKLSDDPPSPATRSGQSLSTSVYRTKIAGHSRLITVTWCRHLLAHAFSISLESHATSKNCGSDSINSVAVDVELRPWHFWRRHGSKQLHVDDGRCAVAVFWDLRAAKFSGGTEPRSDYYVAVVFDDEVVLLLGDLKKDAYRRAAARPSLIDAALLSKKEHVVGKKRFSTRAKFNDDPGYHDVSVEFSGNRSVNNGALDSEMIIRIGSDVAVKVTNLHWKFRGNETVTMKKKVKVEVYWDVHDFLFSSGARHALFIFRPVVAHRWSASSAISSCSSSSLSSVMSFGDAVHCVADGCCGSCFFLYAWKLD